VHSPLGAGRKNAWLENMKRARNSHIIATIYCRMVLVVVGTLTNSGMGRAQKSWNHLSGGSKMVGEETTCSRFK
jgi:hypothetical protein